MAHQPTYDRDRALERVAGDEELLEELNDSFLEESGQWMNQLRQAIDEGDAETVGEMAHTIKGAADTIGGVRVTELAKTIEDNGWDEQLDEAREHYERLEIAIEELEDELDGG